jgi:GR25 family glycosyltransferase involved in LPS biosynthesis
VHDRCFRGLHSRPWPDPDTPMSLHVGANESVARRDHQRAWLKPWLAALPCLRDPNWSAQVDQGLVPDPSLLRARMPQQLAVPSSPAQPLEHVYGFYINLDTQVERDHTMRAQFERLGLSGVYQRFNAIGASLAEAHSVGLKSAGELGLWRSTLALLQSLELQDLQPNGLIHILEDDAIVCDQWPFHLASTLPSLLNQHSVSFDLLFTDSFLTPSLARKLSALDQLRSVDELFFLDGGLYLACTSSYILPVSSLRSLVLLLLESFERRPLSPLDMVLRDLMLTRKLRVLISSPFLTTIDSTASSGIQSNRRSSVLLKMQIDILLRRQFFVESLPLLSDLQSWFGDLLSSGSGDDQALLLANLIDHWELSGLLSSY